MKVLPMIRKMVSNYNYEREAKFLDKYCKLDNNLSREVSAQLYPARKGIANYAKSKGVTVTITDAEKRLQVRFLNLILMKDNFKELLKAN